MKINLYWEDCHKSCRTIMDVPAEQFSLLIETDYRERLSRTDDPDSVTRRTAQEILDEQISKPTYNAHHRASRHCVSLDAMDPEGVLIASGFNLEEAAHISHCDLYEAIKTLSDDQKELLWKVFWDNRTVTEIAEEEGIKPNTVTKRLSRIYARLKNRLRSGENE